LMEETGGPGENHRPATTSHWQTLSHNRLDLIWIFIAPDSSLKYYTFLRIDISLYSETLSRFRANMLSLLLLLNTVYLAEKQQRLTLPGLEPTKSCMNTWADNPYIRVWADNLYGYGSILCNDC
jgi:hypothetical protein